MRHILFVCVACLLAAACLFGQQLTSLSGNVTDPTGAVLPQAHIQLENVDTGVTHETVSDADGRYSFPQIQPGNYRIAGKAAGFQEVTISDVAFW